MNVLVIGANGKTGKLVVQGLVKGGQHRVRAMVREPKQIPSLEEMGAETVVADLENDIPHAYEGVNAVIFAAGSGSHTGLDKTEQVDHLGAVKSVDEAIKHGVNRFIMLSSLGADDPAYAPEKLRPFLEAKAQADDHLMQSKLSYTIVRPGALSDDPAVGTIAAGRIEDRSGSIPRADVANTLIACLDEANTVGKVFEILSGGTPIDQALQEL
ncbi:SDR family oxidoreductase [Salinithrix halophila]|uniref:SDR family oxidoreductase n=1 Tax=Salinithrix halophila TaxID=1485204 RepID=A0ABV8JBQ4_9BACL